MHLETVPSGIQYLLAFGNRGVRQGLAQLGPGLAGTADVDVVACRGIVQARGPGVMGRGDVGPQGGLVTPRLTMLARMDAQTAVHG